jgi:AraC-like DNA-binding protein
MEIASIALTEDAPAGSTFGRAKDDIMHSRAFSTEPHAVGDRERVWREAMDGVCLPIGDVRERGDTFHGDVMSIISPLGLRFSRLSASPQTISGRYPNQPPSIWVALLIDGVFLLGNDDEKNRLMPGDIVYGPTGMDATLAMESDFRLLYIRLPGTMLHPRLLNPMSLKIGTLKGDIGGNRVFAGMLRSIAEDLEHLTEGQIRPLELALPEFLIASLAEDAATHTFGSSARAAQFHRLCQSIEMQLGDPGLTLRKFALSQHASPRYIQKLFAEARLSFAQYLRSRRLERCRADLGSVAYRGLSISDICFRWGFNDAAHFSRTFHQTYGVTPRSYRQRGSQSGARTGHGSPIGTSIDPGSPTL